MATEKPELVFKFIDVPVQSGTYDCQLFAIAFVTALAQGEKPELFYIFFFTNGTCGHTSDNALRMEK